MARPDAGDEVDPADALASLDAVLALVLMVGGVFGAQFGARAGQAFNDECPPLTAPGGAAGNSTFASESCGG